jgi:hypothetical protein
MIDDPLEQQLLTLQRVEAPPPPSVADLEKLLRRGREQKTRARRLAVAASAAAVAAGAGTVWTLGMRDPGGDQRSDVASEGRPSPDDNDVSGGAECDLAGPDPATDPAPWDVAGVGDVLEARFPSCFGGIANTGEAVEPLRVAIWVIGEDPAVLERAEELFGPDVEVTMRPSDLALRDVRELKHRIDDDIASGELADEGIVVHGAAIRQMVDGPRVLVLLGTDTPEARARLEELYGRGWLEIVESSGVLPG